MFDTLFVYRLQSPQPPANGGPQVAGVVAGPGRVPAVRDDVCQLPEAARLQQRRGDARQASPGRFRGTTLLPPLLNHPYHPHCDPHTSNKPPMCICVNAVSDIINVYTVCKHCSCAIRVN